jgi:hypothetical protein
VCRGHMGRLLCCPSGSCAHCQPGLFPVAPELAGNPNSMLVQRKAPGLSRKPISNISRSRTQVATQCPDGVCLSIQKNLNI